MVCLNVISYVLDAWSAEAFSLPKVYSDRINNDPGAQDVIWMAFSVIRVLALPQ